MPYKDPDKQRAAQLRHVHEKRRLALAGRHCERCGTTDELEFHHRDPAEKISHRIWSWSWERIAKEIEKCEVLCAPCHKAHHRAVADANHGTVSRYRRGCRCSECREAKRLARPNVRVAA